MQSEPPVQPDAVAYAVQRAVQVTVARKVSVFLSATIVSQAKRVLSTVGASVLLVGMQGLPGVWDETTEVAADLSLAVTAASILDALAVTGPDTLPLTLVHLCGFLIAGEALASRYMGATASRFVGNAQYLFATVVTQQLLAYGPPFVAFVAAAGLSAVSSWSYWADGILPHSFALAAVGVFKAILLESIPPALLLPSVMAILSFSHPLAGRAGAIGSIYSFTLYQAADAVQSVIQSSASKATAAVAGATLAALAPTQTLLEVAQIVAVGTAADLALSWVERVAATDPVLAFMTILVGIRAFQRAFPGEKK